MTLGTFERWCRCHVVADSKVLGMKSCREEEDGNWPLGHTVELLSVKRQLSPDHGSIKYVLPVK